MDLRRTKHTKAPVVYPRLLRGLYQSDHVDSVPWIIEDWLAMSNPPRKKKNNTNCDSWIYISGKLSWIYRTTAPYDM